MTLAETTSIDSRPRAATVRPALLRAELGRLRRRRLISWVAAIGLTLILAGLVINFITHNTDLAGARAKAANQLGQMNSTIAKDRQDCLDGKWAGTPKDQCPPAESQTPDQVWFDDPRFIAPEHLPALSLAIAVFTALLASFIAATSIGADWTTRTIITLVTWEPRRVRYLNTRFTAIAIWSAGLAAVAQLLGLAGGALAATFRGTWSGVNPENYALIKAPANFWPQLINTQLRGIALAVIFAILSAAITTIARYTGAFLGLGFFWFVIVENAVRVFFMDKGWDRWILSTQVTAFLQKGGHDVEVYNEAVFSGNFQGNYDPVFIHISNLDAFAYLGSVTAIFVALALFLLRRRDL